MTSSDLITCLPSALSCTIMRDWLSLKSVVALDSAFCCHSHRNMFLDLVQSDEYYIREQVNIKCLSKIMNVLQVYGEKLRAVTVIESNFSPAQEELLVEYCHNLTHVRFRGDDTCTHILVRILNDRMILVDLANTYLDDFTSLHTPQWSNLTSLGLGNTGLKSQYLSNYTRFCPNVVHLDVAHNRELTDADVLNIVTNWTSLRGLNITGDVQLTDASLTHIYTHCAKTLHTLHMNCRSANHEFNEFTQEPLLSSAAISELLEQCTQLCTFHIKGTYGGGDIELPPSALRNITTLILGDSIRVGNIATTNNSCLRVQTLAANLSYLWNSMVNLVCGCSNLKEVFLDNTYDTDEIYPDWKISMLQAIKPGVKIQRMHHWENCRKHLVMNM